MRGDRKYAIASGARTDVETDIDREKEVGFICMALKS